MSATLVEGGAAPPRSPGRPRDARVTEAIIGATLRQLDAHGYAALSVESVASAACVSRATVYRRFADKADLVTAAIASRAAPVLPRPGGTDPRRELVCYLEEFEGHFASGCIEVLGGLLAAREEPHALALHRERVISPRLRRVRGLLTDAQGAGLLDSGADLDLALEMLVGSVLVRQVIGAAARPDWAERAVDAVLKGMAPAPLAPHQGAPRPRRPRSRTDR